MSLWRLSLAVAVSCSLAAGAAAAAGDVFLRGGTLIDPDGEDRLGNLLVVGGVIAGFPDDPPEDFRGEVVDARGGYLIPGLRDLHVHSVVQLAPGGARELVGTAETARRMLYAGVVGFLDLFNTEDYVLGMRDRQRAGELGAGADIFAAGPCLTATGGHCTQYRQPTRLIDSPLDARREIQELADKGPDVVKLVYEHPSAGAARNARATRPTISLETLEAAIAAASEHGLRTVVHVRSWRDVREVARAGATAITHLPSVAAIPDDVVALLVERETVVIPTLSLSDTSLVNEPSRLEDPLLVAAPAIVDAYRSFDRESDRAQRLIPALERALGARLESVRRLSEAGVPVVLGTDSGNWFTVLGYSVHRELELLTAAGLPPRKALAAATSAAGDFLGRPWGLEVGDEGSVLVLEASPLEDIGNTREIRHVIHHGRRIDRASLLAARR